MPDGRCVHMEQLRDMLNLSPSLEMASSPGWLSTSHSTPGFLAVSDSLADPQFAPATITSMPF